MGVWGNHDFGICRDVPDEARAKFEDVYVEYAVMRHDGAEVSDTPES